MAQCHFNKIKKIFQNIGKNVSKKKYNLISLSKLDENILEINTVRKNNSFSSFLKSNIKLKFFFQVKNLDVFNHNTNNKLKLEKRV